MNLDDKTLYEKFDKHEVARSIALLPDQMRQVLGDARLIKMPEEYAKAKHIVVAGMGGSNLGIRIIRHAFAADIKVPINIVAGYGVPAYVGPDTLFILSSYSGTTEEPLATYAEAKKRGAMIAAITKDGEKNPLKEIMMRDDVPGYVFKAEFNPSEQPRLGLGYSIFGTATLLAKAGFFAIDVKEIEDIIAQLELNSRKYVPNEPVEINLAKRIALELYDKMPILCGAEHTSGNLHTLRNQINENAKAFASYLIFPDANHFAMEGLMNPAINNEALAFLFVNSDLYDERIAKRMRLTAEVVRKNGVAVVELPLKASTRRAQCFELLQIGSWVAYYLGIAYGVDPANIPWVDWFKAELAK